MHAVSLSDCIDIINGNLFDLAKRLGQHQAVGDYYGSDTPYKVKVNGIKLQVFPKKRETFGQNYPLYAVGVPNISHNWKYVFVEFFYLKSNVLYNGNITNTVEIYCWFEESDSPYSYEGKFLLIQ